MLGLGLGLKLEDFTRVLKTPKDFIVGFISQLIILPLVAYLLIIILKTPPEIAIGVMIIAAAPGGVTSNIMTKFADGDVALSISLTAIISLLSIITVPFIIFTSADLFGITNITENISMTGIALKMFLVVTVPVILGMIIRKFAENFVASKGEIFNKLNKQSLSSQLRPVCQQLNSYVNHASRLQIIHFLFSVSASDNEIHASEINLINRIASYLNINQYDFESIQSMFISQSSANNLDKWFSILEIDKNASDNEVKKAHRKMVTKYHPDKLQGVSEDIIKLAEEKFLLVQQAYEQIIKSRS